MARSCLLKTKPGDQRLHIYAEKQPSSHLQAGVGAHACHPSAWDVEAEGSQVQGYPWPKREFKPSLSQVRLLLKSQA